MLNKKYYNPGNHTDYCPPGKHAPAGHMHTTHTRNRSHLSYTPTVDLIASVSENTGNPSH